MIFVLFLCVVSVFPEADSQTEKKPNYLDLKATSCSINVVTASHKKLENVVLQMKRKLDEIQMDLRNLTQIANKNNKGKTERLENVHFLFFFSINGLGLLLRCWFRKFNEYLYDLMFFIRIFCELSNARGRWHTLFLNDIVSRIRLQYVFLF